jgi:hypothetical protein
LQYYGFRKPTTLAKAVAEFNEVQKQDPAGAKEPPLAEEEVYEAAREAPVLLLAR